MTLRQFGSAWRRTMVLFATLSFCAPAFSQATDLFFSEYIEGSSNNKALEIYNGAGAAADLSEYTVELYSNGSTTPGNTLNLADAAATLANGDVLVIANPSADPAILSVSDITSTVTFFNGDDAIALLRNGAIIDVIGVIGSDPGSSWGTAPVVTGEATIVRKASVCSGDADGFDNPSDISDQWEGYPQNTFDSLGGHLANCAAPTATDLLFSEYVEGSSNNKALEIYNGTGAAADLTEYTVEIYNNGAATPNSTLALSDAAATLADGDALVIANASAVQAILDAADITSSVTFFNGDDALVLRRNGVIIDVIGIVGSDPGSSWGTAPATTVNATIRRLDTVCSGDANGFDNPADISDQWEGFPSDTFDGLGSHTLNCSVQPNAPVTLSCSDFDVDVGVGGAQQVAANDADGNVINIAVINVTPTPGAGSIMAMNVVTGSAATADIFVSSDVPQGSYSVEILAENDDATPQSDTCTLTINVLPPATPGWVINEFLADPATDLTGDANGDGVRDSGDDEFVEIVNDTGSSQDISGFTITDGFGLRHTFPAGTTIANGEAIVVFGGGTPTGDFGGATVQTASTGALGLNNGGDTITFASAASVVQAEVSYGGEGGSDESLTLDPDVTGTAYVQHSGATGSGGALFSPGTQIDGAPFVAVATGVWVINEFLADPATDLTGDANGDGVRDSGDDEFVEIVNDTGLSQDISGYAISDGAGLRHTFPAGTSVADGEAIVVFGGGTPTGDFGGAAVQTASSGALGLNNGGDTITFASDAAETLAEVSYGGEGGGDQSLTLDPDVSGTAYVQHSTAAGSGGALFSPGTKIDGSPFGGPTGADDLFFSEYLEGSSNNKAIEIYNGTGAAADLSEYRVELYSNGSTTFTQSLELSLIGPTLADGDVVVIANSAASSTILAVADITSEVTFFNGDDTLALLRNGVIIDVIGRIGNDPPAGSWGTSPVDTNEATLRRLPAVCAGNPVGFAENATDITAEWEGFPRDDASGLGAHLAFCGDVNFPIALDCDAGLVVEEGIGGSGSVTANDPDGVVDQINVVAVTPPPAAGSIAAGMFTPASGAGGTATLEIVVSADVPVGTYTVDIEANNADMPEQSATCQFTVSVTGIAPIHDIQGPGLASPLADGFVATNDAIVTALLSDGFYIQEPDDQVDADPNTAEGIFVFTGGAPTVSVGDRVNVSGDIIEFFDRTQFNGNLTINVLSSGNPLPAAITLTAADASPTGTLTQLERFEGMRVRIENALASGPSNRFGDAHVVLTGQNAVREKGILTPGLPGLPVWDGNPELIEVDPDQAGLPDEQILFGATVTAEGPINFTFGDYQVAPTFISVTNPTGYAPVRAREAGEFTVGALNLLRLFQGSPSAQGYADRLAKISRYIREQMGAPEIIAFSEVGGIGPLQDLAARMQSDDASLSYSAHMLNGNDPGGIEVGFLTQTSIRVDNVYQIEPNGTFLFNGQPRTLHDRPPLVLEGAYTGGLTPFDLTAIAIHNRSLIDVEDIANGEFARQKRLAQAESIANAVQNLQTANADINLIMLGDFNAFHFTDGFVDVTGVMSGNLDPEPAYLPGSDLVNPDLVNLVPTELPENERYSFNSDGNGQPLDHALVSQALLPRVTDFAFARGNSGAPPALLNDGGTVLRASDHDGMVAFISPEPPPAKGIIDNLDPDFAVVGDWTSSTVVSGYIGSDYLFSPKGDGSSVAEWSLVVPVTGQYRIAAQWTAHPNRAKDATYVIEHDGGVASATVDQRRDGGQFNRLGTFSLTAGQTYTVTLDNDAKGFVIADAVRWMRYDPEIDTPDDKVIDNQDVRFEAVGDWTQSTEIGGFFAEDYLFNKKGDGSETAAWTVSFEEGGAFQVFARWTAHPNRATDATYAVEHDGGLAYATFNQEENGGQFNLIGVFDFSAGTEYAVTLSDDADGFVIADAVRFTRVPDALPPSGEIVVDNGDPAFNDRGQWHRSQSVAGFLGDSYLFHPKGDGSATAAWTGVIPESGQYEVFARWTAHPNRATDATYQIEHAGGTASVNVDQMQAGGQYVSLGTFAFNAGEGYAVTLSNAADGFVIADAVKWVKLP